MKSPKILGQLTPGTAVGVAKARALQETGAPFLTARGPGYTTRLKNGFVSVTPIIAPAPVKQDALFWMLRSGSTAADPPGRAQTATLKKKVTAFAAVNDPDIRINSRGALNVGANRMAYTAETIAAQPPESPGRPTWPVLGSLKTAGNFEAYLRSSEIIRSCFATGWDDDRKTWRWGFSAKAPGLYSSWVGTFSTSVPFVECAPRISLTGLDTPDLSEVVPPNEGDRVYYGGKMYVTGPGKLAGLVTVGDYMAPGDTLPTTRRVTPYILSSDDHGETWTKTPVAFTIPYIRPGGFDRWDANALRLMGASFFVYMGEGKSIFVLRYLDAPGTKLKSEGFIYEAGAFTPTSLGFDTNLYLTSMRLSTVGNGALGFIGQPADGDFVEPDVFCFGPGCVALPTFSFADPFASQGFSVTRNFGASWDQIVVTDLLGPEYTSARILVERPYLSEEVPGRIYFMAFKPDGVYVFLSDGLFLEATQVGFVAGVDWSGAALITKSGRPHPQLPDEFGPP